jgi:hypothetical protein
MTQELEQQVREVFAVDAARAPGVADLTVGLTDGALSKVRRRRRWQAMWGSAAAVVVVGGGVAINGWSLHEPSVVSPPSTVAVASPTTQTPALDVYRAADAAFFGALRSDTAGVSVTAPPATLRDLRARSTVVVLASVVDVQPSGEVGVTPMVTVTLNPRAVLFGALEAPGQTIRVPFLGLGDAPAADLGATLPSGQSVWFLRWQGAEPIVSKPGAGPVPSGVPQDLYALTHAFGVLMQGKAHVETPLQSSDTPSTGFLAEVGRIPTLSAAADGIRGA